MIEFSHIEKSFFGVKVLKAVSFTAKPGQTIGIVGENGAGKSTLMNILGGNLQADAGFMRLNGQPYAPTSPGDAERAGIAFIHQELNLFANLSIAENLFLRGFPRSRAWLPFINRRQMSERTRDLLHEVDLAHSPDTPRISPRWSWNVISCTTPGCESPRTSSKICSVGLDSRGGNNCVIARPTISETSRSIVKADVGSLATTVPSRSTTISSQSCSTWPRLCEM